MGFGLLGNQSVESVAKNALRDLRELIINAEAQSNDG